MQYEANERDGDVTVYPDNQPGWYVRVDGEEGDVFASGPGERSTNGEPGGEQWRCAACDERTDEPETVTSDCQGSSSAAPVHDWQVVPLSWCNSAHITLDPDDDAVHVSISVGDPRGRFVFTVRKLASGQLIMHTPYPGEGMPHMTLTQDHPGTYLISN